MLHYLQRTGTLFRPPSFQAFIGFKSSRPGCSGTYGTSLFLINFSFPSVEKGSFKIYGGWFFLVCPLMHPIALKKIPLSIKYNLVYINRVKFKLYIKFNNSHFAKLLTKNRIEWWKLLIKNKKSFMIPTWVLSSSWI